MCNCPVMYSGDLWWPGECNGGFYYEYVGCLSVWVGNYLRFGLKEGSDIFYGGVYDVFG